MKMNPRTLVLTLVAFCGAVLLVAQQSRASYEDQLIGVAVEQTFRDAAREISSQPLEIQALLLDYADDEALLLKTRAALLRYPELARRILPVYGAEPEFREVLRSYGEAALPPIGYFMDNDLLSLKVRQDLDERWTAAKDWLARLTGRPTAAAAGTPALTAEARGWYAVNFLREAGYGFLGQFEVTPDGTAHWVQTERWTEGLGDLFLGGIRNLEAKSRLGQQIEPADVGGAVLDVAVMAASLKLLRVVRAAKAAAPAARVGGLSRKLTLYGSGILARGSALGIKVARLGAVPAAVYLMVRYPSLANATLAELADWLGIAPWMVQLPFWFVALYLLLRLTLWALRPLSAILGGLAWTTARMARWARTAAPVPGGATTSG